MQLRRLTLEPLPLPKAAALAAAVLGLAHGSVKAVSLPVHVDLRPNGNCYWNVEAQVELCGGDLVLGWALEWWPRVFVKATHHAVWRDDAGVLWDVTAPDEHGLGCTFVRDDRQHFDLDVAPTMGIRYLPLRKDRNLSAMFSASAARESVAAEMAEALRRAGNLCQNQRRVARGAAICWEVPAAHEAECREILERHADRQAAEQVAMAAVLRRRFT